MSGETRKLVLDYRRKVASLTGDKKRIWELANTMVNETAALESCETQGLTRTADKHSDAARKAKDELLDLLAEEGR